MFIQKRFPLLISLTFGLGLGALGCSSSDAGPAEPTDSAAIDSAASDSVTSDTSATDSATGDTASATDTATTSDTAPSDTAPCAPGAKCNCVAQIGSEVPITAGTGTIPTGTGGTFSDGTYKMTEFKAYPGSAIKSIVFKQTITLSEGGTKGELVANDSDKPEFRTNFAITTTPKVKFTETCSTETGGEIPYTSYTATATTFTMYAETSPYLFSVTYTK
ncbi:MAG: hypothetical protein ABI175_04895 [Polyangiales bacterium]